MMTITRRPWRPRRLRRRFFSSRRHLGPRRPHFDGAKFLNLEPTERWARQVMRWMATRKPTPWPRWIDDVTPATPIARVVGEGLRITLVNHSTVLIQTAGINLLTDPVWSRRVGPFPWLGPKRVRRPGIAFDELPKIDCVLLSHDHYDHLDVPTLRRLVARDQPRLLCGLGVDRTLEIEGLTGAEAMDWHGRTLAGDLEIIFTPCRHFSGRGLKDQDSTLWGSFLLRTPQGNVYFAGDTGYGPHFDETRRRYGDVAVALLPIGCYEPRWFMRAYHMSPDDALQAHQDLGAAFSLGIHYGTFRLGDEGVDAPVRDLERALAEVGLASDAFRVQPFGDPWDMARAAPARSAAQSRVVAAAETW